MSKETYRIQQETMNDVVEQAVYIAQSIVTESNRSTAIHIVNAACNVVRLKKADMYIKSLEKDIDLYESEDAEDALAQDIASVQTDADAPDDTLRVTSFVPHS